MKYKDKCEDGSSCSIELLNNTYMSVTDISDQCGISRQALYSRKGLDINRKKLIEEKRKIEILLMRNRGYKKQELIHLFNITSRSKLYKYLDTLTYPINILKYNFNRKKISIIFLRNLGWTKKDIAKELGIKYYHQYYHQICKRYKYFKNLKFHDGRQERGFNGI